MMPTPIALLEGVNTPAAGVMPVLYVSHGAPILADHPTWPQQLAAWSKALPRPSAILIVSAHWESAQIGRAHV